MRIVPIWSRARQSRRANALRGGHRASEGILRKHGIDPTEGPNGTIEALKNTFIVKVGGKRAAKFLNDDMQVALSKLGSPEKKMEFFKDLGGSYHTEGSLGRMIDEVDGEKISGGIVEAWDAISSDGTQRTGATALKNVAGYLSENPGIATKIKNVMNNEYIKGKPDRVAKFLNSIRHNQVTASPPQFRFNPNEIKLLRFADPDEILAAMKKFDSHRTSNAGIGNRNLAYTNGMDQNDIMWVSGNRIDDPNYPKDPNSESGVVEIFRSLSNGRENDTEFKALTKFAHEKGVTKSHVIAKPPITKADTGTITIFSENPVCSSCNDVIKQFQGVFPNIKFIIAHGIIGPK